MFYEIRGHILGINQTTNRLQKIKIGYNNFNAHYQANLGNYFRNLFFILKRIHNNDFLTIDEKNDYIILLRAQLTKYELLVLFYNGLSELGYYDFKPLLEEHGIFKHIQQSDLLEEEDYQLYNIRAFDLGTAPPEG